jgi:hypothetical protein
MNPFPLRGVVLSWDIPADLASVSISRLNASFAELFLDHKFKPDTPTRRLKSALTGAVALNNKKDVGVRVNTRLTNPGWWNKPALAAFDVEVDGPRYSLEIKKVGEASVKDAGIVSLGLSNQVEYEYSSGLEPDEYVVIDELLDSVEKAFDVNASTCNRKTLCKAIRALITNFIRFAIPIYRDRVGQGSLWVPNVNYPDEHLDNITQGVHASHKLIQLLGKLDPSIRSVCVPVMGISQEFHKIEPKLSQSCREQLAVVVRRYLDGALDDAQIKTLNLVRKDRVHPRALTFPRDRLRALERHCHIHSRALDIDLSDISGRITPLTKLLYSRQNALCALTDEEIQKELTQGIPSL